MMDFLKNLGYLSQDDPLYGYLRDDILPRIGPYQNSPNFKVFKAKASNHVYVYEETGSQSRVIGKFFANIPGRSYPSARNLMEREFNNLNYLRSLGFIGYPHYIARPLGINENLNCFLVEEFCNGTPLNDIILGAIRKGSAEALFQKLTALAFFLATLHNRTAMDTNVEFFKECSYFDKIVQQLIDLGFIGSQESQELYRLKDRWYEKGCMWEDRQVVVHGDVTPTNFLFGDGQWVVVIDLERMKPSDRVFDLGRVTGELKHFFMQYAGSKAPAEPYIGHFLWEYATHFPDRESAFASITRRIPFYMALNLLRIARNSWIVKEHRMHLLKEARKTLRE